MSQKLIEEILETNLRRSEEFRRDIVQRREYREKHPTEIAATMCMDGRLNFSTITSSLFGLVTTFRNIGGVHDVGWPMFHQTLNSWEAYAHSKRRPALIIITYHWSASRREFGCKGFDFDLDKSLAQMLLLRDQIHHCYHGRIFPLVVGIETDSEALVVLGDRGLTLDMRHLAQEADEHFLQYKIDEIVKIPEIIRGDLVPLLLGNAKRVLEVRQSGRTPHDCEHCERVLGIGQGFDWLNHHNLTLVVGLCDPSLNRPIITATKIIRDNWLCGRIEKGGVLLVSTPYRDPNDRKPAMEQSKYLARFAAQYIREEVPDMADFFTPLVGVINRDNRRFELCSNISQPPSLMS